jgi:gamma-glutamylcyclotransferase (GGCT)/AIG2-like uncharacterized protein YtfP
MGGPGARNVFVYGTLLVPSVVRAVTGRDLPQRCARLPGFARYRLHGEVFPAVVADPSAVTEGALIEGVVPGVLDVLDRYEGALYERHAVRVQTGERTVGAHVYVLARGQLHRLTRAPWDLERFAAQHLSAYLARCRRGTRL